LYSEDHEKYYDVLELDQDASFPEIRRAYLDLKELYSSDSIVTSPIADEFSEFNRKEILEQIEEAYTKLKASISDGLPMLGSEHPELSDSSPFSGEEPVNFDEINAFDGRILRQIREELGIHLFEIATATKVPIIELEKIETENYDDLPPDVYLRGFLAAYAKYLLLDPEVVVADYLENIWYHKRNLKGKNRQK
jgi:hypothetical protein